jgi:hypothetical protein
MATANLLQLASDHLTDTLGYEFIDNGLYERASDGFVVRLGEISQGLLTQPMDIESPDAEVVTPPFLCETEAEFFWALELSVQAWAARKSKK